MKYRVIATFTASFEVDDTDYDEDEFSSKNVAKSIQKIELENISDDPYILFEQENTKVEVTVEKVPRND